MRCGTPRRRICSSRAPPTAPCTIGGICMWAMHVGDALCLKGHGDVDAECALFQLA